jgi:hypothetical protein
MFIISIITGIRITNSKYSTGKAKKAKAIPLHAMKALWGRGGIVPTHSRLWR